MQMQGQIPLSDQADSPGVFKSRRTQPPQKGNGRKSSQNK